MRRIVRSRNGARNVLLRLAATAAAMLLFVHAAPEGRVRIFLIGDSTMADKPLADNPERGWGQVLPLFCDGSVSVFNHAKNGRSTKSFIDQGLWQKVRDALQPGDYVFIQFGHNDAKKEDSTRYAAPRGAYRENLVRYVHDTRARGAIPILLTPVNRRKYDSTGVFVDQHGEYPSVVREVASEERVMLIDLHAASLKLFTALGPGETLPLFLKGVPAGRYKSLPGGKDDNTHFTFDGAFRIASLVVDGIMSLGLPLSSHFSKPAYDALPGLHTVVGLDYWYNSEWKRESGKPPVQVHYTWEDTTFGGFSELGALCVRLGAEIDTIKRSPTDSVLAPLGMYLIVDPDTPAETETPNYLETPAIDALERWVKSGGVLVVLANDSINCEHERLNALIERFGIHMNSDCWHRVQGRNFAQGAFEQFPEHPIFNGVHKLYLKEISSLRLSPPAEPVLTEDGRVFMASARAGKGLVFVVGDPWLYNEYYDRRKLPEGFDNDRCAARLMEWLLRRAPKTR